MTNLVSFPTDGDVTQSILQGKDHRKILLPSLGLHMSQIIVPVRSQDFFQELYAAHGHQSLSQCSSSP